jgi:pectinesterase
LHTPEASVRKNALWILLLAALGLAVAGAAPAFASAPCRVLVAADGTGDFTTVQAAVDAVPADNARRYTILIRPGVYREVVHVPQDKPFVTFAGTGRRASDVVITFDNANGTPKPGGGTYGTSGSATVTLDGNDFLARHLTFENSFDEATHPEIANHQAVAVLTHADRVVFDDVRFLGNQDTLYLNSPSATTVSRVYLTRSTIAGDVDFIFGRATAVFDRCVVRALDRGQDPNGYVTAASTAITNPYGFLFTRTAFVSDAPAGTYYLGRPWHPGNDPDAIAQVTIRDSWLGPHIKRAAPWSDFGTAWSWRDARYFEHRNAGPGAGTGPDRPQLTPEQAAGATARAYLAGTDGWDPHPIV